MGRSIRNPGLRSSAQIEIVWCPQDGPQKALVDCPFAEVFFGGSRGGGKTDGMLGKWALKDARYGAAFSAMMFRRTAVSSAPSTPLAQSSSDHAARSGRLR